MTYDINTRSRTMESFRGDFDQLAELTERSCPKTPCNDRDTRGSGFTGFSAPLPGTTLILNILMPTKSCLSAA